MDGVKKMEFNIGCFKIVGVIGERHAKMAKRDVSECKEVWTLKESKVSLRPQCLTQ